MQTKDFHFSQQQQNIIGAALQEFASTYEKDMESPAFHGTNNLSALLEDFLDRDRDVIDLEQRQISEHAWTVRNMRQLLQGVFDPRVLPAIQQAIDLKK